jgi:DNA-binding GntR family transcriptional regulator
VHLHLSRLYTGIGLFDRSDSSVEHVRIVEALRNTNQAQAVALLNKHIQDVQTRLVAFLDSLDKGKT